MTRVVLVRWNAAEAAERALHLRRAGHEVGVYGRRGGEGLRTFREDPPGAFVIDLGRLPSHGRAVATFLRQQKATRGVPIVFVGGAREKVARVRKLLPDALGLEPGPRRARPRPRGGLRRLQDLRHR